jgi:hypothetical protein
LFVELLDVGDGDGVENVDDISSRNDGRDEVPDRDRVERLR